MPIEIRPSTLEIADRRRALIRQAWAAAYPHIYTAQEMDDIFTDRITQTSSWRARRLNQIGSFSAFDGDQLVGVTALSALTDGDAEVVVMYVRPDQQRAGIGRLLWARAEAEARKRDAPGLWVWTLERGGAVAYYERMGCTARDSGTFTIGDHAEPAIGLWKAIEENED